jgi:hypothetical protein
MALIKCPECGASEVSDKAAACPRCGAPIALAVASSGHHPHRAEIHLSHEQKGNFNKGFGGVFGTAMGEFVSAIAMLVGIIAAAAILLIVIGVFAYIFTYR